MDILLIFLAVALLAGVHSALHGVLRPIARRTFPPRSAPSTKIRLPEPEPEAADARRRDRFLLVLCALLLVGTFLQCFVL